ncbi:MAG: SAM-dependent methyltransferase [Glaciecola sp.]|jgi:SAM-dependent methyltransferase
MSASPLPESSGLVLTGERTLPGIPDENYWFQRHVVAYEHVADLAAGSVVLDAGCGEGYGLRMLAQAGATRVIGVDLDSLAVAHAKRTYADDVIEVHEAELMALPLAQDEVDLTVSFQVIEHLHDIPGYLASLRRVTKPGGTIVIATPNRLTFTPDSLTPVNPFHTVEFTGQELRAELERAGLIVHEVTGVHHGVLLDSVEHDSKLTMTQLQAAAPEQWPSWLRQMVHRTKTSHFKVFAYKLDHSLDLIARCTVPSGTTPRSAPNA